MKKPNISVWIPIITVIAFVGGSLCGKVMNRDNGRSETEKKFYNLLNLIESEYVDEVDIDSILELTMPSLLSNLDPHSVYIPADEFASVNEQLEGTFSGVGVSFTIDNDTIHVIESVAGGPAEKVGIKAGDRILKVDGDNVAGIGITNDSVFARLRGPEGTLVVLQIKRASSKEPLEFTVERGAIPITSIDSRYMAAEGIGYIKVKNFGRMTYDEFWHAANDLQELGAKDFIIDLRGNVGGLLETAILMANEFMPRGLMIVQTKGRHPAEDSLVISDGTGSFQESRVIVLIDEYSASSSEIFAGAIQDNDRGLILGRRSFGKGLVQHQISMPDNSAVRLTVARYYTPSGRCIQKDYSDALSYENDLLTRFEHGEAFESDSIKFDESLKFLTMNGRTVYGGGGIMPDIFIPNDTTGMTGYFVKVANSGLFQKFTLQYSDTHRDRLEKSENVEELLRLLPDDYSLVKEFVDFVSKNKIPARWHDINISRNLIVNQLQALIARDILGVGAYYEIINTDDPNLLKAIEQINSGKADFPIMETDNQERDEQR